MLGQEHWNEVLRIPFNPKQYDAAGKATNPFITIKTATGSITLSVGDKVMATDNGGRRATEARFNNGSIGTIIGIKPNENYNGDMTGAGELLTSEDMDMQDMWDVLSMAEAQEHATDGDLDLHHDAVDEPAEKKLRQASHIVTVIEQSTGTIYELSRSAEISTLQHAYAVTCNKFQGSQARNVIVICHSSMPALLTREWLYTACSRAQKAVFLLHDTEGLRKTIDRVQLPGQNAFEKADRLIDKYKETKGWAVPRMPEPHKLGN
jgi:ATP-dependent exoDNAse (exonuclease V) alpha subunit